ncbi:MAG TPA: homoserine kinase, partial [Bacteroidales bacterium]|nr:homoserine kinase [Bacteroidales bacterium]
GINELLGRPLSVKELIPAALKGEFIASGSIHADNIAPALLGGFVLIRDYDPLDIISLKAPESLFCTVVHPDIEIRTSESRRLIAPEMPLRKTLRQCGNIAGLIAGITTSDYALIGRSLEDVIAEPVRARQIPGYPELKQKLIANGALGANISGSGPSVFAFSTSHKTATRLAAIMTGAFEEKNINSRAYVSGISPLGTRLIEK